MCMSLYFCIFSYNLEFRPTYFTFWRSHTFTFHSVHPALNSDVIGRFSAVMCRYFIIILVAVVVGFAGVTIGKLLLA